MTYKVTDAIKKTVADMAEDGLGLGVIAATIDCCENTLRHNTALYTIYKESLSKIRRNIAKTVIARAFAGGDERETASAKLLMFLINTRFRFTDIKLSGSYQQKMKQLHEHLADNDITLNEYNKLSDTLCKQFQVEEHEQRLTALEKIVEEKQNLGGYKQRDDL